MGDLISFEQLALQYHCQSCGVGPGSVCWYLSILRRHPRGKPHSVRVNIAVKEFSSRLIGTGESACRRQV